MRRLTAGLAALMLLVTAIPLSAQGITCDDISFDERIIAQYPLARDACLDITENEGVRYAHFEALVHREGSPSLLLRFKHRNDTWGPPTMITVPAGYPLYIGQSIVNVKDVRRGMELGFYLPEGRWEMAVGEAGALPVEEATFAPIEFEVVAMELPEEVDMQAPPLVAEEQDASETDAAEAEVQEADQAPAEEQAAMAEEAQRDLSDWYWILGLAAAFIIVWILLRRKKAAREA